MVYTNLEAVKLSLHGIFESSRIRSSQIGHIYDALVKDSSDEEIAVDNGVMLKIGDFTGNGLQEVKAIVAGVKDKVAITGAPALIKSAFTTAQNQVYNYTNVAGNPVKTYELVDKDIFGVAKYQFTDDSVVNVKVGAYVVLDGAGKYVAQATSPTATSYGFIGKVHSITVGTYYTIVRIEVIQNVQRA